MFWASGFWAAGLWADDFWEGLTLAAPGIPAATGRARRVRKMRRLLVREEA